MPRGGYRPGAGRPKGSRTRQPPETMPQAVEGSPLAYLLRIVADDTSEPKLRTRHYMRAPR